jgi:hypothetical protein
VESTRVSRLVIDQSPVRSFRHSLEARVLCQLPSPGPSVHLAHGVGRLPGRLSYRSPGALGPAPAVSDCLDQSALLFSNDSRSKRERSIRRKESLKYNICR